MITQNLVNENFFFDAHYVLKYMGVESQKSEPLPGMASLNEPGGPTPHQFLRF